MEQQNSTYGYYCNLVFSCGSYCFEAM